MKGKGTHSWRKDLHTSLLNNGVDGLSSLAYHIADLLRIDLNLNNLRRIRSVCGTDQAGMDKAVELIKIIVTDFEEGMVLTGKVVSIKEFGALCRYP